MYYRKAGIILPIIVVLLLSGSALRAQENALERTGDTAPDKVSDKVRDKVSDKVSDKVRDEGQYTPVDTLDEVVVAADRIREIVPA